MTKEKIRQYRYLKQELDFIRLKLGGLPVEHDSVDASMVDFPYTKHQVKVAGVDNAALERLTKRHAEVKRQLDDIEKYIEGIVDSFTRMALTLRYMYGYSWAAVAQKLGGGNTGDGVRMAVNRVLGE